jgi:hypothetical protein
LAFSFAILTISSFISLAKILYSQEYSLFLAESLSFSIISAETIPQFSKANFLHFQGAIFLAIIRASITIVPLQQKGSKNASLNFQPESKTKAAAKLSFKGASQVSFL